MKELRFLTDDARNFTLLILQFSNMFNRGCASKSKNPRRMVVMDFVTNMFKHLNLDVKKGPTPYLGLTQPLGAVLRT